MTRKPLRQRLEQAVWSSPTAFTPEGVAFGLVDALTFMQGRTFVPL
jgi:hypothetical protein